MSNQKYLRFKQVELFKENRNSLTEIPANVILAYADGTAFSLS